MLTQTIKIILLWILDKKKKHPKLETKILPKRKKTLCSYTNKVNELISTGNDMRYGKKKERKKQLNATQYSYSYVIKKLIFK